MDPPLSAISNPASSPAQLAPKPPARTASLPDSSTIAVDLPSTPDSSPRDQLRPLPDHLVEWILDNFKPPPPPGDCCGSGCSHCVWDIHSDLSRSYTSLRQTLIDELASRHVSRGGSATDAHWRVKVDKWKERDSEMQGGQQVDESQRAFREMERALAGGGG